MEGPFKSQAQAQPSLHLANLYRAKPEWICPSLS